VRVRLHPLADRELEEVTAFYRRSSPRAAEGFVAEFARAQALLAERPEAGAVVEDAIRRFVLDRYPYGVVYEIGSDHVLILALAHHRRRPAYWRRRVRRGAAP
jgi:toxin ParE1/3/4